MKKSLLLALAAVGAGIAWYQAGSPPQPLAQFFPSGALVYLESKDFARLLNDWNSSTVKQDWLGGTNYAGFQRSNLFIKLGAFYKSYGAASGFTPDMASLQALAGDQSALALYDLQHVQFAYITRLPEAKVAQTKLWLGRKSFQTREASGVTFYVNSAEDSTVAFATTNGYLVVATGEERMAGMLGLLTGKNTANIAGEGWYGQSANAAGAPGELRLVMNLESLAGNNYFRSYWVQRNTSDVRRFLSGVADIHRTTSEIAETRVFLERPGLLQELPPANAIAAAATLAHLAPDDAGLYRIWAKPRSADAAALLESHILDPHPSSDVMPLYAPAEDQAATAGSEANLETRIDQPPLLAAARGPSAAATLLAQSDILAMLQVQRSNARPGATFLTLPCAIALVSATPWDAQHVEDAIGDAWTTQAHGSRTLYRIDGLGHTAFTIDGSLLVIANDSELLQNMIDRPQTPAPALNATYFASFRHAREQANYTRLMTALDFQPAQPGLRGQQPAFFSGNIASLSAALRRVTGVELTERALPDRVEQRVVYALR